MAALRGDPPPIPADTPVRLYSMEYCPFAQRARVALKAKGVKFDVINCNLKNKPKFLTDAHPNGQVPVLLHKGNVIVESEIIVEYVDQAFPDQGKTLYSEDAATRAKARAHITFFGQKVMPLMYKVTRDPTNEEEKANLLKMVEKWVEEPLSKGGAPFFGGQEYNAVDVNIWPWIERFDVMVQQGIISLAKDRFPALAAYVDRMKSVPAIAETVHSAEEFKVFYDSYKKGEALYNHNSPHPLYEGDSSA